MIVALMEFLATYFSAPEVYNLLVGLTIAVPKNLLILAVFLRNILVQLNRMTESREHKA